MYKMKKNLKNHRGVATIIGSILSIVILIFFFSNVFLWHNGVSSQMNQVMADKLNSQIDLTTIVLEEPPENCTDDPQFGGYEDEQYEEYGIIENGIFQETHKGPDGIYQTLNESSDLSYIALNATYTFTVDEQVALKSQALTFSFYGKYVDDQERCSVYIWNNVSKIFEDTGITITSIESWYNITLFNPQHYISSGAVNITYLSNLNPKNQSAYPDQVGILYIDVQHVALSPVGLTVRASGSRDTRLLRLWIINETVNEHDYIDFNDVFGREIWVPGGSSINVEFRNVTVYDGNTIKLDLSNLIGYSPILGEVRFRIITDLGNTAMIEYE